MAARTLCNSAATASGLSVCWAKRERLAFSRSRAFSHSAWMACFFGSRSSMKSSVSCARRRPRPFPEQRALEQRLGDLLAGTGHRDGDAEVALDALVLADQHIEDHAVDRVVGAVVGDDAHLRLLLPEAVHPAFALLVARGVPGQVVVQHGVEVLLEVDAFRQAVGADEHILTGLGDQRRDARFALGGRQQPGDRLDPHLVGQGFAQLRGPRSRRCPRSGRRRRAGNRP